MRVWCACLWLAAGLGGCVDPAVERGWSTAALAPSPPGWFAFCNAHGGGPDCDPVPQATAMRDGKLVGPPQGWRDYCARHPASSGCSSA